MADKKTAKKPHLLDEHYIDRNAPSAVEYKSNYIFYDDKYAVLYGITSFPSDLDYGWLSSITNYPNTIVKINVRNFDTNLILEQANADEKNIRSDLNSGKTDATAKERLKLKLETTNKLIKMISRNKEEIRNVSIIVMLYAPTIEALLDERKRYESFIANKKMKARVLSLRQEKAMKSLFYFNLMDDELIDMIYHNIPLSTFAGGFPAAKEGFCDKKGLFVGFMSTSEVDDRARNIVILDKWFRADNESGKSDRTNSNISIFGASGTGKSTLVKKIIIDARVRGEIVCIIDPEGEYGEMCQKLDGQEIDCAGGGDISNPFQFRDFSIDDSEDERAGDSQKEFSPLGTHLKYLRSRHQLYFEGLSITQKAELENMILQVYVNKEITLKTTYETAKTLSPIQYPIYSDLYELVCDRAKKENSEDIRVLKAVIEPLAKGADSLIWNGYSNVNIEKDFLVFNTKRIPIEDKKAKMTQYFDCLNICWERAELASTQGKKIIIIADEAHTVVDPENPQATYKMYNISKRIRKRNGSLVVATQGVNDFLHERLQGRGETLLDNATYKFLFGAGSEKNLAGLEKVFRLNDFEKDLLLKGTRGLALQIVGNRRFKVDIMLTKTEETLMGTGGGV